MLFLFFVLTNLVLIILGRHLLCYTMNKAAGWVTSIPLSVCRNIMLISTVGLGFLTSYLS